MGFERGVPKSIQKSQGRNDLRVGLEDARLLQDLRNTYGCLRLCHWGSLSTI